MANLITQCNNIHDIIYLVVKKFMLIAVPLVCPKTVNDLCQLSGTQTGAVVVSLFSESLHKAHPI